MEAFFHCQDLEDIYYEGTKEQWNLIPKDAGWNGHIPHIINGDDTRVLHFTVHCTDGDLDKDGNEI